MKRVTGIGGIFLKADNPESLYEWYEKHLGIKREPMATGRCCIGARTRTRSAAG